jgi:hypothetical protein
MFVAPTYSGLAAALKDFVYPGVPRVCFVWSGGGTLAVNDMLEHGLLKEHPQCEVYYMAPWIHPRPRVFHLYNTPSRPTFKANLVACMAARRQCVLPAELVKDIFTAMETGVKIHDVTAQFEDGSLPAKDYELKQLYDFRKQL